jgi:hypothetical protein
VLHLGANDPAGFLKQSLVRPMRIDYSQFLCQAIVFTDQNNVKSR